MKTITFNTKGYDGFIDFIKAYTILCVLFGHTFLWLDLVAYNVWAGLQVPKFILIQSFHFYKKDMGGVSMRKMMKRVLFPFLMMEIVTILLALLLTHHSCSELAEIFVKKGGYGPGSYFPWIYLQIALLLPVFGFFLRRFSKTTSLAVFLLLCEGLEILCSVVDFPDAIYRLLAIRYFFLLYLGYQWAKEGVVLNAKTVVFSILSLAAIIYFEYFYVNDEPWFYLTNWKCSRWPCYFFVAYGFTAFLHFIWDFVKRNGPIVKLVRLLSKSSYEIFLIQMSVIFLFELNSLSFIHSPFIRYVFWVMIVWATSIGGGVLLNRVLHNTKSIDKHA